jgi:hypothetical protein
VSTTVCGSPVDETMVIVGAAAATATSAGAVIASAATNQPKSLPAAKPDVAQTAPVTGAVALTRTA